MIPGMPIDLLIYRRDTLEEIFLKAMGHLSQTPGEGALDGGRA